MWTKENGNAWGVMHQMLLDIGHSEKYSLSLAK